MAEAGRSMVEIIGMLAVAGVLSIGGVAGYSYAIDKNKANRIMKDVELAYVVTSSANQKETGLAEFTDASSGYPTFTELIVDEDFQTDIVLVKNVPESVCDKILDMTENTAWFISSIETDTNYLYPLTECEDMNAMIFSTEDIREFEYTCEKECPANMMCGVNDECICATGFEMDETGKCVAKTCNLTLGPDAQPDRYCCEEVGGTWNYDAQPQMCGCDEGYFFNGKECTLDNWCSYTYTVPELLQVVQSDCAFDYTVPETVTTGESEVSLSPVSDQTCNTGEYCILNWINGACTSNVSTYGANTTTRIYGRCAPLSEHYNVCKNKENGEVVLTPNKECIQKNTYCSILWGNQTCKNVGTYNNNTQTDLYGVCLSYDGTGEKICPFK